MKAQFVIGGQMVTGPEHFDGLVTEGLKRWHASPHPPADPNEPVVIYEPDLIIAIPGGLPWMSEPQMEG